MAVQGNPRRLATVGAAAFAVHVALVGLYWPIPPMVGSFSVPLYLLGNLSVLLIAEAVRRAGPAIVEPRVDRIGTAAWRAAALGAVVLAVAGGLTLRAVARELYFDFWREDGVFEPLTLLAYAASAALLWTTAPRSEDVRPWRLAALAYLVLALEEIDWFGIFGGAIGRIDGVYVGSLHDVITLAAKGLVPPLAWVAIGATALALAIALWRTGWLCFAWLSRRAGSAEAAWVALAFGLLALGAAEDAGVVRLVAESPTAEEAIELGGAIALAAWAVESVARILRRR